MIGASSLPQTMAQEKYRLTYATDGAVELSPTTLLRAARRCLTNALAARRQHATLQKMPIVAVGGSGFWHSLLGLDRKGDPLTPILTWADSRGTEDARQLRTKLSERAVQERTGCMLRASFWPAKLVWLRRTQPRLFARVSRWVSPVDWVYEQLFGVCFSSASMVSATGLFNQQTQRWDEELCARCKVRAAQLPEISEMIDSPAKGAGELKHARILTALGDGAASNLGSGAVEHGVAAISIGTSAAVRIWQVRPGKTQLPFGLFRYVVDGRRHVVGGAMSNAGNLRQWCLRELRSSPGARWDARPPRGIRSRSFPFGWTNARRLA